MNITDLSPKQLRKAAHLQEKIFKLQTKLADLVGEEPKDEPVLILKLGKGPKSAKTAKAPKVKRGMSAEGRARIIAAQKARWAKINAAKGKGKSEIKSEKPAKRTMSAAAKAKIGAAAKARWAAKRAENKTAALV